MDAAPSPTPPTPAAPAAALALPRSSWRGSFAQTLNPVSLFFGPVFTRDMRILGRKRFTFAARAAYLLLLTGILSLVFFGVSASFSMLAGSQRLQQLQTVAPISAQIVLWFQFFAVLFLAPTLTAGVICDEKRNRTLSALATTPLTSAQIIFSSLASRIVQLLIIALSTMPLLLALRSFGGLDVRVIIDCTIITSTSAVMAASLALLASVFSRKASGAFTLAIVGLAFISIMPFLLPPIWGWLIQTNTPNWMLYLSTHVSPFGAMFTAARSGTDTFASSLQSGAIFFGIGMLSCVTGAWQLRRVMLRDAASENAATSGRSAPRAKKSSPATSTTISTTSTTATSGPAAPTDASARAATTADVAPVRLRLSRIVGTHPVAWREIRQRAIRSKWVGIVIVGVIALLLLWAYIQTGFHPALAHVPTVIGLVLLIVQACGSTSSAISGEMQSKTWHALLTTPLTAKEILLGKLAGGLVRLIPTAAIVMANLLVLTIGGALHPIALVHIAIVLVAVALVLSSFGLLMSLMQRRGNAATTTTVLAALGFWAVLPLGLVLVGQLVAGVLGGMGQSRWLTDLALVANPFYLIPTALGGAFSSPGMPASLTYSLSIGSVGLTIFSALLLLGSLILVGMAAGFLALARLLFPRYSIRGL